jgi:hypothetical protein
VVSMSKQEFSRLEVLLVPFPCRLPHTISSLEGTRFEPPVPLERKRSAPCWRALISGGG